MPPSSATPRVQFVVLLGESQESHNLFSLCANLAVYWKVAIPVGTFRRPLVKYGPSQLLLERIDDVRQGAIERCDEVIVLCPRDKCSPDVLADIDVAERSGKPITYYEF